MVKKHIFATYGSTPIKNVKTPIRKWAGNETEEQEVVEFNDQQIQYVSDEYRVLQHIRLLLLIIIVLKLICLFRK